eukprot:CAMPEP_0182928176 /NCGR_PEP_ID=MMETSP0105_2-20130417/15430_1 /TAXON_ID=81532 ORGANISM="Acanthoeca-like sp., Strain 10tr" /NCGR_SAMPLE_ID=MMETSP0105_2 /ASSEMBLY_ACC=CAM_ASM_000205 /LENGTH=97 /DNA_ID=CAMNT_0025066175 /DNA_START=56 /DNA_END=349 /DNA_ORIENTATION=-
MASRLISSRLSQAVSSNNAFVSLVRGQRLASATTHRAAPIADLGANETYIAAQSQFAELAQSRSISPRWDSMGANLNPPKPSITAAAEVDFYVAGRL